METAGLQSKCGLAKRGVMKSHHLFTEKSLLHATLNEITGAMKDPRQVSRAGESIFGLLGTFHYGDLIECHQK